MIKKRNQDKLVIGANRKTKEKDYWLEKLSGELVKCSFPLDYKSPAFHTRAPRQVTFTISCNNESDRVLYSRLMELSKDSDTLLHMILAAVLAIMLKAYTGCRDIIVGTPIYKQKEEKEFINTVLAIRNQVMDGMTFRELLAQVRTAVIEANRHQNFPLEVILEQLNKPFSGNRCPLFDTALLLRNIHHEKYLDPVQCNMLFSFLKTGKSLEAVIKYNPSMYKKNSVERKADHFRRVLRQVLFSLHLDVSAVKILSEKEKEQLLFKFNDTMAEFPGDKTIHELFEEQVEKMPGNIAVVGTNAGDRTTLHLSYRELNEQADELARRLRQRGAAGTIVAIMVERSIRMVIGILGILKAGGGYLPLDPDYPQERTRYMLEDSHVGWLVTDTSSLKNQSVTMLQGLQRLKTGYCVSGLRPQIDDMDELPFPDRSLVDYETYHRHIGQAVVKNSIALQATRGCPYNCAYCHKIWPKRHVVRSAENIFEEITLYYNMGVRRFVFIDDIFNLDKENSARLFRLIIENRLDLQLFFPNGLRGDVLSREYIDLMVEAGTVEVALALETASPRLQKLIGKNLNLKKLRENIQYFCEKHPQVILELFVMHGFPTETEAEAMMTLDFVKSLKWLHFPYFHILKIYPNTGMEKMALSNGISPDAIAGSANLAYHQLPETLPFDKAFTRQYQAEFVNRYFLSKERLLHVLPFQMKVLTRDEVIRKYDSYLPMDIHCFEDILECAGMQPWELPTQEFIPEHHFYIPSWNEKIKKRFPYREPAGDALRVLLLDLSLFFKNESHMLYDVVEPPLGLMNLMTYLKRQFDGKINGKILKSRIDFDNYVDLSRLLEDFNPDVIGIRTLTFYKDFFHQTVSMIRSRGITAPIIAGGPYATSDYATLLQDAHIDLAVLGEGEHTFVRLIREIMAGNGKLPGKDILKEIPGIAFRTGEKGLRNKTGAREILFLEAWARQRKKESHGEFLMKHVPAAKPSDLAYIIYTSGTTGKPKGVMVEHRNVVRLMFNDRFPFNFSHRDTWTLFHAGNFDFSVWEMYGALLYGGKLAIVPKTKTREPREFLELLVKEQVTVLNQTPLAFYNLAREELKKPGKGLCLKYVIFGGDALKPLKLEQWKARYPETKLINMFGITETTVHVTYKEIGDREIRENISSVGKPLPTSTAYVMNEHLKLLPIGTPGELTVGGEGTARGYLNRPGLSAEKFVINPYIPGKKLYRSGDRVTLTENGEIEYGGRIDQQVKIRGYRIEPGEIENRLMSHDAVKETVVIDCKNENGDIDLCAYVVVNNGKTLSSFLPRLSEYLAGYLPGHMMPVYFVQLEKIPLTPNGKVDRESLPGVLSRDGGKHEAPRDSLEKVLAEIWQNILTVNANHGKTLRIGRNDNYFNVGGDSIKAIKLLTAVNERFAVDLKVIDLFTHPTIRQLARRVRDDNRDTAQPSLNEARREIHALKERILAENELPGDDIEDIYPMSDIEKSMIYLSLKEIGHSLYHDQIVRQGTYKAFSPRRFRHAFSLMVEKHPILRTAFNLEDFSQPVQIVYKKGEIDIRHYDVSQSKKEEQEAYIEKMMREDRAEPFDISRPGLWRLRTFARDRDNIVVLWISHHAILDGWSDASLMTELNNTYVRLKEESEYVPEKLKNSYKEFVIHQIAANRNVEIIAYWQEELEGYKRLEFPFNVPDRGSRERQVNHEGNRAVLKKHFYQLEQTLRDRLTEVAQKNHTTLKHLCFAAYVYMLSMLSFENDIVVGLVFNNRPVCRDSEKILGCFVNTIPVRIKIPDAVKWLDYISLVDKKIMEVTRYKSLSLFEITRAAGEDVQDKNPIFDTLFNFIDFHIYDSFLAAAAVKDMLFGTGDGEMDTVRIDSHMGLNTSFDFGIDTSFGKFRAGFGYMDFTFDEVLAGKLFGYFEQVLDKFANEPDSTAKKSELIPGIEKKRLLEEFNGTASRYPHEKTIHGLFEENAGKAPDSIALVHEDLQITYRRLNRKANGLARILRFKGVGEDTVIALIIQRSVEMITGILGILKAGGAYLPIEPDAPLKRMISLLEDSHTPILLTDTTSIARHPFTMLQRIKDRSAVPCRTAVRPQVTDLDSIQVPDRSLIDYEKYNRYIGEAMVKNCITMQATRGCPYHCAYCHKIWPKSHVFRSAENIFREVLVYYNMGIRRFAFIDDIFNLNKKNSLRFFELIIKNSPDVQIFFPNGVRGDILTSEYIDIMVEAGTVDIAFALETASPRLQKLIGKNLNLEKFKENIRYTCNKYPHVMTELFTMHGFPSETEEEAMMTLDFIKSIKWLGMPYILILKVYPNTDMETLALENGVSPEAIRKSEYLAYHELPDTLPFDKTFTKKYQTDFLNNYLLLKERLLAVLPNELKFFTPTEILMKYNDILPQESKNFDELLRFFGITRQELTVKEFLKEDYTYVPDFNRELREYFPAQKPAANALRVLFLDLSQEFKKNDPNFLDMFEPPLGPLYILTHLNRQLGDKINGKILKSGLDFDDYTQLREQIREFKPEVIGIRTLTNTKNFFHKTVGIIKLWYPDVPVIAGGPYATSGYTQLLNDRHIDLVVLGEGEITFCEFIETFIENGKKLPGDDVLRRIPGIAFLPGEEKRKGRLTREIVILDELPGIKPGEEVQNPGNINTPNSLAYGMFTSGSTGKPKAVLVKHKSVLRLIKNTNYIEFREHDNILPTGAPDFDASTFEIWGALLNGSSIFLLSKNQVLMPGELKKAIRAYGISKMWMSSPLFNQLLDIDIDLFRGLEDLVVGGDVLSPPHIDRVRKRFPRLNVINGYGPTENTTFSLAYQVDRRHNGPIPIGKPISNSTAYILDCNNRLLPIGVAGELCVGGDGVARGYMNNPQLTNRRFITGPFVENEPLYKTGDLARWLYNGNVEFLGRIDRQVKIRGYRIELGEIENRLTAFEGIEKAVVVYLESGKGEKHLCAYIVPCRGLEKFTISPFEIMDYLAGELHDYMIPAHFIPIQTIPLTANGKIDRKALPAAGMGMSDHGYAAPTDEIEEKLARIWSEILEIDKDLLGIDSNFFEIGGHSLRTTILIARIHREFHVKIPVAEVFEKSTIRELGKCIRRAVRERFAPVKPVEKKEYYAVSPAQKRFYILQELQPENLAYNLSQVVTLENRCSVEENKNMLQEMFQKLIKRQEILRTSFEVIDGQSVQRVHDEVDFEIEYYDLATGEENYKIQNTNYKQIPNSKSQIPNKKETKGHHSFIIRPFDMSRPPLLRVGLLKNPQGKSLLFLDMHHIISDGISHEIMVKDFRSLYRGEELPSLNIQYKDYSGWQASEKEKQTAREQEKYWINLFAGEIPVLDLPTDFPRPKERSFEGNMIPFQIGEQETESLNRMALEEGATLFMVLLTLYTIFLSKLTHQEDIVVGTPVSGRSHADIQQVIGVFINTLALRNYPRGENTLAGFLESMKQRTLDAFENQNYPFEDLVEKVVVGRDTGRNPLFDAMFDFHNEAEEIDPHNGADKSITITPNTTFSDMLNKISKFDLNLHMVEKNNRIFCHLEYCTKLFSQETIERWIQSFKEVVLSVLRDRCRKISQIELLNEEEKTRVLYKFNAAETVRSKDMVVHRLFENQVEKGPHHLAVIGADGSGLTYRELNRKANKLAYTLRKRGFRTGGFIAVIMEHSLEMIVAVMGILKAGAAYVPLEPGLPPARIKQVLTSIQVGAAVTGGSALRMSEDIWKHRQPGYLKTVLCLTKTPILNTAADELFKDKELVLAEEIDSSPGDNLVSTTRPGDIAYVIHTSGSTGTPKGVVESHQPVVNIIQWVNRTFDIGDLDKLLFVTSLGFDLSVYDIFGILASGASIRVASPEDIRDPGRLSGIIYDEGITFWDSAPAALKLLITFLTESRWDPGASGLRLVFLSGDWIPVTMPDALRDIFANIRVISLGGATEATIWSNYYPVETVDPLWTSIPYGKPIQNSVYYILDLYMNPCLIGVPGDLYIGGPCLASGYINDVELTAGKFIRNPFIPGRNMYKTGDLARWYNDGNMEFLGRKDHQVKIRGYRVELGDIESHLLEHEYIKEAVVLASKGDKEEKSAEKFLCAYITAHKELAITGLREYLARYLPAYMIPAYFVQMEHIPLNSNGKIDRKRLPAPGAKPGIECAAPRDEMEKILTEVWREVLAVQNIGIDDDFFELGGDSIKSIQIASSLKKYGFKLKVRDVFGKSTIRELATCVDKIRRTAFQGVVEGEVPLTPIQQWFFQNPFTHCHHFNHAVMLYRQKGFDESILNDVFRCITLHHDALRIVYSREHAGNRVVQVNQGKDAPAFHLEVIHIHGNENIEVKIEKEANRLQACIDLEKGGLVKIGLFKTPYGDHLLIVIHHLVVDGVSWRILLEDLELGISQAERGEDIKFREKTDSYKYWSEKLREYAAGSSLSSSMDYWKALEETTVEPLPGDKQVSPGERKIKYNGTIVINLDETETAKLLKDVHRAYNTEINDILLAALALGIREWAGLDKVAVDLEGHGRESIAQDLDVSRTVGWFTSLYPVVLDLGQANQPAFAVKSVKETLRKIPGNGIDYGVLKYLVPGYKKQEPGFSLRPEISFNYLGQFHPQHAHGSDSFSFSPMKTGNSINPQLERQYAIDITGILVKGQLTVSFSYSRYKYRAAAIEQLANAYRSNLLKIIDHCVKKEERETTPADLAAGEELSLGELEDIKQFTELYISE